jgi:HD-GYP domain-containing protein (c-di-GMP phosphodiesterase class II)
MISSEDREIQKLASDIINQLSIIIKTALIHDPNNVAVRTAIGRLLSLLPTVIRSEKGINFELFGEFFYIDGTRIRYTIEYLLNFDFLVKEFRKREIGGLLFKDSITPEDVQLFLKAFIKSGVSEAPYETISEMMAESQHIRIDKLKKVTEDRLKKVQESEEVDVRKMVKKTYFNAVTYTKGVMNKIRVGERVDLKKAKRIIEAMVDHLLEEEHLLLGMTAIKDYDEYTYHHMVNVSILSIALGQRLGLNRQALTELGLSALFHDIGKIEIPHEVLNKPTRLTDDEWELMRKHPVWGVMALLRIGHLNSTVIRSAIIAFEHHMNCDFTGYPKVRKYKELDFYSRVVSLADQYDALTSARVYKRTPVPPDKTLSIMMENSGSQLDPLLFKFFINMVGVFPIGTLVMLSTREIGLVYESNVAFVDRPRVLIIIDTEGRRVKGPVVDLAEKDETGRYVRSILKTLDINKYKVNLAEYFL